MKRNLKKDQRPWGNYRVLASGPGYQIKRIEVGPKLRFSLQKHLKRSETWVVLSGQGLATIGRKKIKVRRGSVIEVGLKQVHRMQNTQSRKPLVFIEVQLGRYLGEDDIVRLEDDFQRVTPV